MKIDPHFAYVQARVQARFAGLPREDEWQRLAASRTLASFLEEARTSSLRNWVKGFSGQSDVHDLEVGIRSLFRESLEAVAGWIPAPWREAVSWIRWLPLLPLLAHHRSGGAMPGWVARDPTLRDLLDGDGELDRRCLEATGATCLLASDDLLSAVWVAEWRSRWPRCSRALSADLEALTALLRAHFDTFGKVSPELAWGLRRELRERLRLQFHRHPLQPAIPFTYLALAALDLERLRAALVSRSLFSAQDEQAWLQTAGRFAA